LFQKWFLRIVLLLPPAIQRPVPTGTDIDGSMSDPFR